jgi:hypothetical protein
MRRRLLLRQRSEVDLLNVGSREGCTKPDEAEEVRSRALRSLYSAAALGGLQPATNVQCQVSLMVRGAMTRLGSHSAGSSWA